MTSYDYYKQTLAQNSSQHFLKCMHSILYKQNWEQADLACSQFCKQSQRTNDIIIIWILHLKSYKTRF